jgi:hypothetical protein
MFMKSRVALPLIAFVLLLPVQVWAAGLPEGKPAPLTLAEIRSLFPGNTATSESGGWHVYHALDGKLLIRMFSGQTDEGTWEITDDGLFCRQWNNFGGGKKACFIYFKKGDEYEYWYADGSAMRGKFKIRPGNPENL